MELNIKTLAIADCSPEEEHLNANDEPKGTEEIEADDNMSKTYLSQNIGQNISDKNTTNDDKRIFDSLRKLLKCTVCFDTQFDANQCKNGHLICRSCTSRLESNATPAVQAKCPTCRIYLQPGLSRCLLAQQLAYELPAPCTYCGLYFRQLEMNQHETSICSWRPVKCRYTLFGCPWTGRYIDAQKHQDACFLPKKKVREIEPIILEYITQKTKPVLELEQAWKEIIEIISEKQRGVEISIKEINLRGKTREIGNTEFVLNEICFTGTTNGLFQYGSQITLVDLCLDLDNNKIYYRIKFTGSITPSIKFRMLSFSFDDLKFEILDHIHTPMLTPNTESQRYSCNLKSTTKQSLGSCRNLVEKCFPGTEIAPAKLNMMVFHDLNRSALRVTPVDIHEWTPNRQSTASIRNSSHAHEDSLISSMPARGPAERPNNAVSSPTSPFAERNQNRSIRNCRNWETVAERNNLTASESLLLDLSTQAYEDAENYFSEPVRGMDANFESNQHSFYNHDVYSMANNNALPCDEHQEMYNNAFLNSFQRNNNTYVDVNNLQNSISREIRHRRSVGGCTFRSTSTQTSVNKIRKRRLASYNHNLNPFGTNMSSSLAEEIRTDPPNLPSKIMYTLKNIAPYLSRMHLSYNLQVMFKNPAGRKCPQSFRMKKATCNLKRTTRLNRASHHLATTKKKTSLIKRRVGTLFKSLELVDISAVPKGIETFLNSLFAKGFSIFRRTSSASSATSEDYAGFRNEITDSNSNINAGNNLEPRFSRFCTTFGAGALKERSASAYEESFRIDPILEISRLCQ